MVKADGAVIANVALQAVGRSYQRTGINGCATAVGIRATQGECSRFGLFQIAATTHATAVSSEVKADRAVVGNILGNGEIATDA